MHKQDAERLLLTVAEAADRLGIGRTTLYTLLQRGEIPAIHIGRTVRIPTKTLEEWVVERTADAVAERETDPL